MNVEKTEYEKICDARAAWLVKNTPTLKPAQIEAGIAKFDERLEPYKGKAGDIVVNKILFKYFCITLGMIGFAAIVLIAAISI